MILIRRWVLVGLFLLTGVGSPFGRAENPPAVVPAPPAAPPPGEKPWESNVALGFNLTSGNSDTILFTLACRAKKEWEKDIWSLSSDMAYGENDGTKNIEKAAAVGDYKRLLTERLYASLHLDFLHDAIANLEWRVTVGPTLGYYFIKSEHNQLNAEAGPSFVIERTDVQHNHPPLVTSETVAYAALRLAERFEHEFTSKAKLWQSVEFLPQVDELRNFLVTAEVGLEAALSPRLSLRVVGQDRYDNEPAPNSKNNDISLTTSLVYKLH